MFAGVFVQKGQYLFFPELKVAITSAKGIVKFYPLRERREKERKDKEKRDFAGIKDGRDIRGDSALHREHLAPSKPSKCKLSAV